MNLKHHKILVDAVRGKSAGHGLALAAGRSALIVRIQSRRTLAVLAFSAAQSARSDPRSASEELPALDSEAGLGISDAQCVYHEGVLESTAWLESVMSTFGLPLRPCGFPEEPQHDRIWAFDSSGTMLAVSELVNRYSLAGRIEQD